jgi:hypothetical protein
MGYGFNWAPPCALVDLMGLDATIAAIESAGLPVPGLLASAPRDQPLFTLPAVNIGRFFGG